MHSAKPSILRLFFILFLLTELLKSAWFFRSSIPSVTPVRSVTRCTEPIELSFIPWYFSVSCGNKTIRSLVDHVWMPEKACHRQSFEQLAVPHFRATL
jgi:hypothetical protein